MPNPPRSRSIHTFPLEIEEMVQRVAAARREFMTTNRLASPALRSTIRESWQRCAPSIEPGRRLVPVVVTGDRELGELRAANELFLIAASPVVNRLGDFLAGSAYIIGLADAQGRLLQVNGDERPRQWLERVGLAPGGDWSEAAAGTNGIGTALAVGHAVQVVGPEHFCDGWQDITCITVPIRYPGQEKIAGVLDISGDYHLVRPFFTGILTAAALEIKQNLGALLAPRRERVASFQIAVSRILRPALPEVEPARTSPTLADDLWVQLDFHQRRAFAAERLTLATGAVSASLDVETTLSQVAEQAAHLLDLDRAAVCLLDQPGEAAVVRAWARAPAQSAETLEAVRLLVQQSQAVGLLRESAEPVAIDDVRTSLQLPPMVEARGIRALALLPLVGTSGVIGLIAAPRPSPYAWQADDLRLGLTFALHSATAIENARLFETLQQQQRHVQALNAVNQLLHTLFDPTQQLDLIVERIVDILDFDAALILLYRKPGEELVLAAHSALPDSLLPDLCEIAQRRAARARSSLLCALKQNQDPVAARLRQIGWCDVILAPLAAGGDVLGVLAVSGRAHRALTDEHLALFTSIGQQLGLALRNTQLLRAAGETEALREADRIKSRFLMTVSHDLRSPLTAIRTSVESLIDQAGEQSAETQQQLLGNIASQAKRLGGLVDRLLDLSRIEAGALMLDRDWTELGALIADTVNKFERLNRPRRVTQQLATDLPLVYIDPDRIVQVLWNLIENADKYSPAGAPITIQADWTGNEVLIRVADRGPGIPAAERDKVFQYFYRLNRDQQLHTPGSGLGLAICRGIVEAHGGRIWVEEQPGGGSVFCVALPPPSADPRSLNALEDHGAL